MLKRVVATEFIRPIANGRTEPSLIGAEKADGTFVEIVAKFTSGCDQQQKNLAREVIAACLAADLGLPVPEPFLVEIPPDWSETIPNLQRRAKIEASSEVAFGSRLITGEYLAWNTGMHISAALRPTAAAIFFFDAVIQNPDRRSSNPNCITRGDEVRIFDHELAFCHGLLIGWQPPWMMGSLATLETPGNHIFRAGLRGAEIDFEPIKAAWTGLSNDRILEYEECIPIEWSEVSEAVQAATKLIRDVRDHIDGCIAEVRRVLI